MQAILEIDTYSKIFSWLLFSDPLFEESD